MKEDYEQKLLLDNKLYFLERCINKNVVDATEAYLGIDFALLMRDGEITQYVNRLIENSSSFVYQSHSRDKVKFIKELIMSRLVELSIQQEYPELEFNGTDKAIIISDYASYRPDFHSELSDIYYEVMSSYHIDIKAKGVYIYKKKLEYLMRLSKSKRVYIMLVDVVFKRFRLLEIRENIEDMNATFADKGNYFYICPESEYCPIYIEDNVLLNDIIQEQCPLDIIYRNYSIFSKLPDGVKADIINMIQKGEIIEGGMLFDYLGQFAA